MNKFILQSMTVQLMVALSIVMLWVSGCSNTPNSITLSKQTTCVQPSMYTARGLPQPNLPLNISANPQQAPSCMAVTIQNNNSGVNATNVQVVSPSGIGLSYTVNGTVYSGILYDQTAAGVSISGATQTVGNMVIYDPNNCATTTGSKVSTIASGGGSCTFYLQAQNEAYALGQYPMTVTYNYTNGNQTYSVSTTITQIINLLAGGASGLYTTVSSVANSVVSYSWALATAFFTSSQPLLGVSAIATDAYQNVYIASNTSATAATIYMFNGVGTALTPLQQSVPANATSLDVDNNGNIYVGTANGVYTMNAYTPNASWTLLSGTSGAIIGLTYSTVPTAGQLLYATTATNVYKCPATFNSSGAIVAATQCSLYPSTGGSIPASGFTQNGLTTDTSGNLYTGNTTNNLIAQNYYMFPYSSGVIVPFSVTNLVGGMINSLSLALLPIPASNPASSAAFLFLGQSNPNQLVPANQSVMYGCQAGVQSANACVALTDNANNIINGNAYTTVVDGAGNVYAIGSGLFINNSSGSLVGGPYFGAFVAETAPSSALTPSNAWTGIATGTTITSPLPLTTAGIFLVLQ